MNKNNLTIEDLEIRNIVIPTYTHKYGEKQNLLKLILYFDGRAPILNREFCNMSNKKLLKIGKMKKNANKYKDLLLDILHENFEFVSVENFEDINGDIVVFDAPEMPDALLDTVQHIYNKNEKEDFLMAQNSNKTNVNINAIESQRTKINKNVRTQIKQLNSLEKSR